MSASFSIRFVLVRPTNALNVGAVARAMANFGLTDLAVVNPYAPRWRAARSAIYGGDLLKQARLTTLNEALADCHIVLGTASAHNRTLQRETVTLPSIRSWLKDRLPRGGRIAVVFGSEKNGLENTDLSHCHALLRIPTKTDAPSMNLGQAVALTAYELINLELERSVSEPDLDLVENRQLDKIVDAAMCAMSKVGVNKHMSEETRRLKVRKGLFRWRMSRSDGSWLQGLLTRLTHSLENSSNPLLDKE